MTTAAGALTPDRRTTILVAAAEMFAEKGFAGTGIDDIGARAGVTGPAIYRYFRGKDALLRAVVAHGVDAFELPEDAVSGGLEAMIPPAVGIGLDRPAFLVTYLREYHRLDDEARTEIGRTERRLIDQWRDAIGDANTALSRDETTLRLRAVFTALGATASRPSRVPRTVLEPLLVRSAFAAFTAPATPQRAAVVPTPGWSLAPSRRDVILDAAMRLFSERGYHGVSMDDIGDAVGISGPTIYSHYGSKLDVLAAAHERASVRTWVAVQDAARDATSASDALDRLAAAQLRVAAEHRDLIVVTTRELAALDPIDQQRLTTRAAEIVDVWIAVLGELRPELGRSELRAVLTGVFPLMNETAHTLERPDDGVPPVRSWALGLPDDE